MSKKAQKTHDSYKKNWNAHRARSLIIWAFFGHFPLLSPLLSKFWAFVQTPPPSSEQIPSILKTHTHIPVFILAVYWLLARAYSKNKPFFWRNVRPKFLKSYVKIANFQLSLNLVLCCVITLYFLEHIHQILKQK